MFFFLMRRNHRIAVRVHRDCADVCFYVPVFSMTEDFIGGFSVVFTRFFIFNVFCRGKNCVFAPTNKHHRFLTRDFVLCGQLRVPLCEVFQDFLKVRLSFLLSCMEKSCCREKMPDRLYFTGVKTGCSACVFSECPWLCSPW